MATNLNVLRNYIDAHIFSNLYLSQFFNASTHPFHKEYIEEIYINIMHGYLIAFFIDRTSAHSVHIKIVIHYSNLNVKMRYLN